MLGASVPYSYDILVGSEKYNFTATSSYDNNTAVIDDSTNHSITTFQFASSTLFSPMTPIPSLQNPDPTTKYLSSWLWIYLGPFVFAIGIVGNLLIILVMGQSNMKGTSTCTYLKWMAVADIFTLVTGMIPEWLDHQKILVLKEIHPITCKLEKFFNFCSTDTSIWICVVFTVDRFVAVCFPMSKSPFCNSVNSKFYVVSAFAAAVLKNAHVMWTRGAQYEAPRYGTGGARDITADNYYAKLVSNCGSPTEAFENFEKYVRPWIAFVTISLVPCLVSLVCNVFIVRSLLFFRWSKNKIPSDSEAGTVLQMTVLCLTASICFMVCNTPSMILLIGKPYWNHEQKNTSYNYAKPIINQIFYINHSINFFLYCITGQRFRQSLRDVFKTSRRYSVTRDVSKRNLLSRDFSCSYRQQLSSASESLKSSQSPLSPAWVPRLSALVEVSTSSTDGAKNHEDLSALASVTTNNNHPVNSQIFFAIESGQQNNGCNKTLFNICLVNNGVSQQQKEASDVRETRFSN